LRTAGLLVADREWLGFGFAQWSWAPLAFAQRLLLAPASL
jgi:hypothetical protein